MNSVIDRSGKWKGIQGGWPCCRWSAERALCLSTGKGDLVLKSLEQGIEGASTQAQMLLPARICTGMTGLNALRPHSSFRAEAKKNPSWNGLCCLLPCPPISNMN